MSAYIVNDKHINTLVSYFSRRLAEEGLWCKINDNYDYLTPKNAQELASQLYKANVKSVNQRYGDKCSDDFKYNPLNVVQNPQKYSIGEIAKAIDGLEYQSCEFDGWHESEAKFNLNAMRKHLLANDIDYEEAETWEIS